MKKVYSKNKIFDVLINVMMPILIGIIIYLYKKEITNFILLKNYAADFLWAYSFTNAILIVWYRNINWYWIITLAILFLSFEILQFKNIILGTGDIFDIVTYLLSLIIALIFNKFFNLKFYKTI